MEIFWIIVIGSSIWVLFDAKTIGVKSPIGWFFACILLWVVSFPIYLAKRPEFKRNNEKHS